MIFIKRNSRMLVDINTKDRIIKLEDKTSEDCLHKTGEVKNLSKAQTGIIGKEQINLDHIKLRTSVHQRHKNENVKSNQIGRLSH